MWENRLGYQLCSNTWSNLFVGTKEIKLAQLQWKILHNIFPTNIILKKIGIKQTENCEFCQERDTVEHTFFSCKRLEKFWKNVSTRIDKKLDKKIIMNQTAVLLGIEQEEQNLSFDEIKWINTIFILGKVSIVYNRMNRTSVDLLFEREIKLRNLEL